LLRWCGAAAEKKAKAAKDATATKAAKAAKPAKEAVKPAKESAKAAKAPRAAAAAKPAKSKGSLTKVQLDDLMRPGCKGKVEIMHDGEQTYVRIAPAVVNHTLTRIINSQVRTSA
jgi:hypothetical protein